MVSRLVHLTKDLGLVLSFTILAYGANAAQKEIIKESKRSGSSEEYYGFFELRHQLSTTRDGTGEISRSPEMHSRVQLGKLMYGGALDAFTTLGMYKRPHTQQILQRKPEVEIDYYPIKSPNLVIRSYAIVLFPAKNPENIPQPQEVEDYYKYQEPPDQTTVVAGFNPVAKTDVGFEKGAVTLRIGADTWTKFFTQKQFTLVSSDRGEREIEDYASHFTLKPYIGVEYSSPAFPGSTLDLAGFYNSRFDPLYSFGPSGDLTAHYVVERTTYYRVRLNYEITPRVALINDFYQYRRGALAARSNDDSQRFRNILRLSCKL